MQGKPIADTEVCWVKMRERVEMDKSQDMRLEDEPVLCFL